MERSIPLFKNRTIFFKRGIADILEPTQEEKCSICRWYLAESPMTPCHIDDGIIVSQVPAAGPEYPRQTSSNQTQRFNDVDDSETVIAIRICEHMYHKGCLASVLTEEGNGGESSCPLCRVQLYRGTGIEDRTASMVEKLDDLIQSVEELEAERRRWVRLTRGFKIPTDGATNNFNKEGDPAPSTGSTFEQLKEKTAEMKEKIWQTVTRARALVEEMLRKVKTAGFNPLWPFGDIKSCLEEGWSEELGRKIRRDLIGTRILLHDTLREYLRSLTK
ncbi:hypothetical protein BDV96DRAFT_201463 [Lophiotrema nucula]|uniref:RING-type domain-containing protein n=1 Tax=Lophiotrema nucula TaxID=690887 RepID=A0A6A5YV32_9PLEO|nr:hypothetical protein BDV96DRAFT_201463 [Lophiotrema nucula]